MRFVYSALAVLFVVGLCACTPEQAPEVPAPTPEETVEQPVS